MNNFSTNFVKLREERGLSIKQVASFTGGNNKRCKKNGSLEQAYQQIKIIAALEGLLGKEISQTLESNDFKPIKTSEKIIEDSLFTIDKEKNVDLKSGIFNRFKSDKEKKQKNTTSEMNVFDVYSDKEVIDDDKKIDFDELYENALEERPYIGDPKQLSFIFLGT